MAGTQVAVDAAPIPLGTKYRITFSEAITDETERTAVEAAVKLLDPNETEVPGAFTWNTDFTELTFDPTGRLAYQTAYTITVTAVTADVSAMVTKGIPASSATFTTMVRGDVNGDGYAELAVAGGMRDIALGHEGSAYVYFGSSGGVDASNVTKYDGTEVDQSLGCSVHTCDVNGDGYEDVVVGAFGWSSAKGAFYVYHGSADGLPTLADVSVTGATDDDVLGVQVACAGDVNGDGFDDVIVGSPGTSSSTGTAFLHNGSADGLAATPATTITGEAQNDNFGWFVDSGGDFNGDGYDDVIVSADGNSNQKGALYAYRGSADGLMTGAGQFTKLTGEADGDRFGLMIAGVGDVNGDGFDDIISGATDNSGGTGAAYTYYGSADGPAASSMTKIAGEQANDKLGFVAMAGDIDGDGYDDVLIGAQDYVGGAKDGATYVHMGSASGISTTYATRWAGASAEEKAFVYPSRDFNGDGFPDAVTDAPDHGTSLGRIYIYGNSNGTLSASPTVIDGETAGGEFGNYFGAL